MKKRQIPHTYAIIFYIILFCAALTWIIPGGQYKESINAAGEKTVVYEAVEHVPQTWQVFSAFYKGFVDKADIIVFILIIGGAFWIVNDSKAFDIGTVSFLGRARKMENNRFLRKIGVENFLLTSIMLLFSIFGAVFGMSEETIAFCLVLVPMAISMGYDSITGVCMVFVAAGLGFAGAILNPFTIGIAQGLAGIPLFSGIEYRIFCWIVINMIGFSWILRYAAKVKRMQGHYERSLGCRPCRWYYRDIERRACHRHHSLQPGERDGRARTSGDRRHDVRDPDLDQPDHSFRKCQSSPDHADHGSLLRFDRIVKASDRDGLPVRRRIHQYDHPDIGSVDRRSGCQPYSLR